MRTLADMTAAVVPAGCARAPSPPCNGMTDKAFALNARMWHPWLRVSRIIITVRTTRWDAATWPQAKTTLLDAMKERSRVQRAGWFN
jgi:hypothetical protein